MPSIINMCSYSVNLYEKTLFGCEIEIDIILKYISSALQAQAWDKL